MVTNTVEQLQWRAQTARYEPGCLHQPGRPGCFCRGQWWRCKHTPLAAPSS